MEKREIQRRPTYEYRCDERIKTKVEGSTRLTYTGLDEGLEHQKKVTSLINERFVSVMGECDVETIGVPSTSSVIRNAAALVRMLSTFDLSCEENAARW